MICCNNVNTTSWCVSEVPERAGAVNRGRGLRAHGRLERDRGRPTEEQQLDVLRGLDAIFLEVSLDELAARDGGALLGGRGASHGDGAHGLARYARQRRAPRMLAARRRAQGGRAARAFARARAPAPTGNLAPGARRNSEHRHRSDPALAARER